MKNRKIYKNSKRMEVKIISFNQGIFFKNQAKSLSLRGDNGDIGIFPGHLHLLTKFCLSFIYLELENIEEFFFASEGILQVHPENVIIIVNTIENLKNLDIDLLKKEKILKESIIKKTKEKTKKLKLYKKILEINMKLHIFTYYKK